MDIVLDSNSYSSDYPMKSARFDALRDYLRKCNGQLVLFKLVHDEVVENYRRKFQINILDPWNTATGFLITDHSRRPEMEVEVKALSERLKNGGGARVVVVSDYADVTIDEVVTRAVKRIPPANKKGEELRDVILWLSILAYAKKEKRDVTLITSDKGFWQEGADKPLPEIQSDIINAHVSIRLYRTLEAFLAENGLVARPADPKWAIELFGVARLSELLLAKFVEAQFPVSTVVSHSVTATEFHGGSIFQISTEAQFAELTYLVKFDIQLKSYSTVLSYISPVPHHGWEPAFTVNTSPPSVKLPAAVTLPSNIDQENNVVLSKYVPFSHGVISAWDQVPIAVPEAVVQTVSAELRPKFSVRLTHGQPAEVTLDSFAFII
ncbi:MAG: PIN domain-containing protein [Terriglobales bacterium]